MDRSANLEFELISGPDAGEHPAVLQWDRWLERQSSVHLEQLWIWGQVRRRDGWTPHLLLAWRSGEIVGGCLILVRTISRIVRVGYISRGPILEPRETVDADDAAPLFWEELARVTRTLRLAYLSVDLPYAPSGDCSKILSRLGFIPHVPGLPPSGLATGALVIDLTAPETEMFQRIRRTLRQNIRQGESNGVTVREGDESDIPILWNLMEDLCRRRNTPPNVSGIDVVRDLWHRLRQRGGRVSIHVAEVNGKPEAAVLTVFLGAWAIPWRIGWSGDAKRAHPEKCLYWHLLRAAKQRGCALFDFNWIDLEEALATQEGRPVPSSAHSGITFFKMGFGGRVVTLPGCYDLVPNRVARSVVRRFGRRLFSSALMRTLARSR